MTILPTGRAWQTAWVEHRWLVYRLVRRPDGKLDKIPIRGRTNAAPEIAACLTFTEAVARTRPDHGIGYLPCPGSILIGLDFDDCITPWDDEPDPLGCRPAERPRRMDRTVAVRPRPARDCGAQKRARLARKTVSATTAITPGSLRSASIPCPGGGEDTSARRSGLVEKVLTRLGHGAPEPTHACAPTDAAYHWFHRLPEQRQDEELERMLDCLIDEAFGDYNDWIRLTAGLWRADCPYETWDTWCRRLPNYNAEKDDYKWSQGFGQVPNPITIGTVISLARQYGYQPPPDAFHWTFPTLAPEDLTRTPGLLGLLVDHGERCTPFLTRLPALAGALAGFATATANRYVVRIGADNHIPLNLYVAMIGDTGCGKESGLRLASDIAICGGIKAAAYASAEGLHRAFSEERHDGSDPKTQLLIQDEWGRSLEQLKSDKAGHQRAVMTKAMECYSLAVGGNLKARHYANPRNNVPAVANRICAPYSPPPQARFLTPSHLPRWSTAASTASSWHTSTPTRRCAILTPSTLALCRRISSDSSGGYARPKSR
jgi:hypothetical protein